MRTQPPGARDGFDPHAHVGATFDALGFRQVGDDYDLRAASRCPWPVRSTHQCGAREGAAPPRHSLASWRINSTCRCGRDVRRIGFASSPATVSIYVPMRVSPAHPDAT